MAAAPKKSPWLHAWQDPVAGLNAFSQCIRLVDLNGDGDYKLVVADAARRLKVYRNTSLISENVLLDTPVSLCVTYSEVSKPRVPSVCVAAGPHVFIYRRLRPYYKFTVPPAPLVAVEADVWSKMSAGTMDVNEAVDVLSNARDSGEHLSVRSVDLVNTEDPAERAALVEAWRGAPLSHQTVITAMEVMRRNMDEDDALSQLVVGTEAGSVLVLDTSGSSILNRFQLPSAPAHIAVTGLYDVEYRIVCACRNGSVYTIKNGEVTGNVIELEALPCGLCRLDKTILVPCMGNVVHCFHIKGKKLYSLYMPAPIAAVDVIAMQRLRSLRALVVALQNGEVRAYNEKNLVATFHLDDPPVGMRFGPYGREEGALITASKGGTLTIKMLARTADLGATGAPPGPPPEQDIPLPIPKKTKLYVEQTQRERDQAVDMHRIFQRDLCKLRLSTAQAYVKVLTDGQGAQSYSSGAAVRLTAQVQGLGPVFKVKFSLQNMGGKPVYALRMALSAPPTLYTLSTGVVSIPVLLTGVTYRYDVEVRCTDASAGVADVVRVAVCNAESKLPIVSAVINMPVSEPVDM